jgi:site-specific recombinase XerC
MALLNSGVNMIYIRDILGHSSISTTEIYLHADSLQKREAIKAVLDIEEDTTIIKEWKSPGILDWLNSQKY